MMFFGKDATNRVSAHSSIQPLARSAGGNFVPLLNLHTHKNAGEDK